MSVLDALLGEAFNPGQPRGYHGEWRAVAGALDRAFKAASIDGPAQRAVGEARKLHQSDPHTTSATIRGVRRHLRAATKQLSQPSQHGDLSGSALRARMHIETARQTFESHVKTRAVPDRNAAIQMLFRGQTLAASEDSGIGLLLESFTGATSFNPSQHPRGGHGYFITTGSQGSGVKRVQGGLGVAQDGVYGPQTKAAIEKFQRQHGLVVDGVIGKQTAAALLGDANASKIKIGAMSAKQARDLGVKLTGTGTRSSRSSRRRSSTRTRRARTKQSASPSGGGGLIVG